MAFARPSFRTFMGDFAQREINRKHVTLYIQGKYLSLRFTDNVPHASPSKTRGICRGFTRSARLRLLKSIAKIHWEKFGMGLFITLTYPDEVIDRTYRQRTMDRHRFVRDTEKYLQAKLCGLWRCEWKTRKSGSRRGEIWPHLHLLIATEKYLPAAYARDAWRSIIGCKRLPSIDIMRCMHGEIAGAYIAKYMSKEDESPSLDNPSYLNNRGRQWGFIRKPLVPFHKQGIVYMPPKRVIEHLQAFARERLAWYDGSKDETFCLLGPNAIEACRIIEALGLTIQGVDE